MLEQPHIDSPFRFGPQGESPPTNDQDSPQEIEDAVENILRYKIGFREDLPEFGIPDFSFKQAPISLGPIVDAILKYEPRAASLVTSDTTRLEEMIENIRTEFERP